MNSLSHSQLQTELDGLIVIVELWIPVLEEMQKIQNNMGSLPDELQILKQQLNALNQVDNRTFQSYWQRTIAQRKIQKQLNLDSVQLRAQFLINNLEAKLPQLLTLEEKIKNLIALRERIEALQMQLDRTPDYVIKFGQLGQQPQNITDINNSRVSPIERLIEKTKNNRKLSKYVGWTLGLTLIASGLMSWVVTYFVLPTTTVETPTNERVVDSETPRP